MSRAGLIAALARLRQLARMAFGDLGRDGVLALCAALAIATTLAPLLTLLGLERGAIGTLVQRLDRDPAMRAITPEVTGANRFDEAWFATLATWPEVAFVVPSTRAIAGQVDLIARDAPSAVRVSWLPTAIGDPVVPIGLAAHLGLDSLILSGEAASKLGVRSGDSVTAAIERRRNGRIEPVTLPLRVAGVTEPGVVDALAAYVSLALLEAVQAYRDGREVPALGWPGDSAPTNAAAYPLFRLYARSIEDVTPIAARLTSLGVPVHTRAREIDSALALRRNVMAVLTIIAAFALGGAVASLTAMQIAGVRRKRREFAVLKLVGYGGRWLVALTGLEALLLGAAGFLVGVAMHLGAAQLINGHFSASLAIGESACRLAPADYPLAAALTLAVLAAPAMISAALAARVEPADELREV